MDTEKYGENYSEFVKDFKNGLYIGQIPPNLSESEEIEVKRMIKNFSQFIYNHLNSRLLNDKFVKNFQIFNFKTLLALNSTNIIEYGNQEMKILVDHFGYPKLNDNKNFPNYLDANETLKEWSLIKKLNNKFWFTINEKYQIQFKNIIKLAMIALLTPMTSVQCERAFSSMKYIKNIYRNCLGNHIS